MSYQIKVFKRGVEVPVKVIDCGTKNYKTVSKVELGMMINMSSDYYTEIEGKG